MLGLFVFSECFLTLGVESSNLHPNGAVKDEQMTASSAARGHPAHYGRRQHRSAWCANSNKLADPVSAKSQYLQIDFLKLKKITAISTEGRDSNSYVDDYYVYYAVDEGAFHSLRHGERNEKMVSTLTESINFGAGRSIMSKPES